MLIRPDATSVALAGTFNQWSASATPLSREGSEGRWTVVVPLPPGEHLFMYVVDGTQWITPPLADDFVDDGFGAEERCGHRAADGEACLAEARRRRRVSA